MSNCETTRACQEVSPEGNPYERDDFSPRVPTGFQHTAPRAPAPIAPAPFHSNPPRAISQPGFANLMPTQNENQPRYMPNQSSRPIGSQYTPNIHHNPSIYRPSSTGSLPNPYGAGMNRNISPPLRPSNQYWSPSGTQSIYPQATTQSFQRPNPVTPSYPQSQQPGYMRFTSGWQSYPPHPNMNQSPIPPSNQYPGPMRVPAPPHSRYPGAIPQPQSTGFIETQDVYQPRPFPIQSSIGAQYTTPNIYRPNTSPSSTDPPPQPNYLSFNQNVNPPLRTTNQYWSPSGTQYISPQRTTEAFQRPVPVNPSYPESRPQPQSSFIKDLESQTSGAASSPIPAYHHFENEGTQCGPGADGLYPHPNDCRKYLSCSNRMTSILDCSMGTAFNRAKRACDWSQNVDCNSAVLPFTAQGGPSPPLPPSISPGFSSLPPGGSLPSLPPSIFPGFSSLPPGPPSSPPGPPSNFNEDFEEEYDEEDEEEEEDDEEEEECINVVIYSPKRYIEPTTTRRYVESTTTRRPEPTTTKKEIDYICMFII